MPFRSKAETARSGKGKRSWIARNLADNENQIAAAQPFLDREQGIFRALRRDMDQPATQALRQAGTIRPPCAPQGIAVLHPEPGPFIRRIGERIGSKRAHPVHRQGKRQRRAGAFMRGGKNLAMRNFAAGNARPPLCRAHRIENRCLEQLRTQRIMIGNIHMFHLCSH